LNSTLERYVKIVHPITHRAHFRPWMVKAGIIIPWLNGLLVYTLPTWAILTAEPRGICIKQWPSLTYAKVYGVMLFVWQVIMPTAVFVLCYSKIVVVVRRRSKVAIAMASLAASPIQHCVVTSSVSASPEGHERNVGPSTSRVDSNHEAVETMSQSTVRGRRIIRTMVIITSCFFVCWCPMQLLATINLFCPLSNIGQSSRIFTCVAVCNIILNPIIYSAHLKVVDIAWRAACHVIRRRNQGVLAVIAAQIVVNPIEPTTSHFTGTEQNINQCY